MATNLNAINTIIQADTSATTAVLGIGRRGIAGWDNAPPPPPLAAAQRATVVAALVAGTVTTLADVLALIATAATGGVTQQQVWRVLNYNDATMG